ncbi:efflux RND transporter periplasmic adaptor subunit [Sphingomonas alpina]|uniref:HlyD family efflux transporter periplasmic adaptor subunit n=1 Tax=Sphingomonas alpina TaxID=653931 RepID=A0A7H0LN44_9SPHN|nr:HlyD family efflux transporter periplasmic adaptor subunit [Sphingomonas alpina]QNQ11097.1 HlyD family efflux transporter periplasmic adaptor subunit [Sphingomonas alpina]
MDEPLRQSWLHRRRCVVAVAAGLVVLMSVATISVRRFATPSLTVPAGQVAVDRVARGMFRDTTSLLGSVVPRDTIYLDAVEGGRVRRVLARSGDRIVAGQPLVEFTNTTLELDILSQEGRLIESITQLQAYQQQLEQNRSDNAQALALIRYDRTRVDRALRRRLPLAARGFVTGEAMDRLKDELRSVDDRQMIQISRSRRQEGLRALQQPQIEAQLATLHKSLAVTRAKLGDLIVRAPMGGRLSAFDLKLGENRNRGDRLGEIALDTGFRVTASIDEYYLGRVRVGQRAEVDVKGRPTALVVTRLYPQVKNGAFVADLEFDAQQPADLVAGEAVRGRLSLGADHAAILLPAGAFLEASGGQWVFVVAQDGRSAERRQIRIGRRNADQVEILAGLIPGERVISSSYDGWQQYQHINLR